MYRKIGFTDDHLDRAYVADIAPVDRPRGA
jgi:hypothetical protein